MKVFYPELAGGKQNNFRHASFFQRGLWIKMISVKRLKILQILSQHLDYGGEERIAVKIEDALAEQHELFRYMGSTRRLLGQTPLAPILVPWRAWRNPQVLRDLEHEQRQNRYDLWLVHNALPALSPVVYEVARRERIPIIQYLHNYRLSCANGFFLNHGKACQRCAQGGFGPAWRTGCWRNSRLASGWMGLILQNMRRQDVFQTVRRWVVPSEAQKKIHIRMGLPAGRIDVIPYFIDPEKAPLLEPPARGDVLFFGRLSQEKGVEFLLRAWQQSNTGARRLLIAGTGLERKKLEALASQLGLSRVEFMGFVPQSKHRELWEHTSFSVIPSLWNEPFPLSMMEAWKHQRPFVGTRLGAMAEVLADGKGGVLVDPFSTESLAAGIQGLLQDPKKVERLGREGREKIEKNYTKELWMERFQETLDRALNSCAVPVFPSGNSQKKNEPVFHACTLFDAGFLAKGMVLYRSLARQGKPFRLFIIAMDDFTTNYLQHLRAPEITVISRDRFEDAALLKAKQGRTRAEYYWTCGSSAVRFVLQNYDVPTCTYLDADMCFYAPPHMIEVQLDKDSIGITPHRYAAPYDQNRSHGVYCVQYVTFRRNNAGLAALEWWRNRCLEWCYARVEDGKFGDQKYLDDWPERFNGVKVLDQAGIGVAPWNCRDFDLFRHASGEWWVTDRCSLEKGRLAFFHFHELRFLPRQRLKLVAGGYEVPSAFIRELYRPYLQELMQVAREIELQHPGSNPLGVRSPDRVKMVASKIYALMNPGFHDHYVSLSRALAD
jgi:glycosyltransferase involved in cell wall biosynthesis